VVKLVAEGGGGGRNDSYRRANREEENVHGDASRLLLLWRRKGKRMVERVVVKPVIRVVVVAVGCWDDGEREKDRENVAEIGKRLFFFAYFGPDFAPLLEPKIHLYL
jgi:hypothetical protein